MVKELKGMPRKYLREGEKTPVEQGVSGQQSQNSLGGTLIVVAFIIVSLWLFLFGGIAQLLSSAPPSQGEPLTAAGLFGPDTRALPAAVARFEENYEERLISYKDKFYGFEVLYPIGYLAMFNPDLGVYLRFQANFPGTASEVIDVLVSNETSAKKAFDDSVKDFEGAQTQILSINGRSAYLISGRIPSPLEDGSEFLVREAFYDCVSEDGEAYTAAVVAAIPEELEPDVLLASYMIRTFKC
ncbi:MAG: hypothetical protein ACE5DI_01745 [Candidatus Micrarchaeia archaeon]